MKKTFLTFVLAASNFMVMGDTAQTKPSPQKTDTVGIVVDSDMQTLHDYFDRRNENWWYGFDGITWTRFEYSDEVTIDDSAQHWFNGAGGCADSTETVDSTSGYWDYAGSLDWIESAPSHSSILGGWQFFPPDPIPYDYPNQDYTTWTGNDMALCKMLGYESCNVENSYTNVTGGYISNIVIHIYRRNAQTTMSLLSGGRAIPGRQILHKISGWVKDVIPAYGKEAQPPPLTESPNINRLSPYALSYAGGYPTALALEPNVPNARVQIGGLGSLHDDPNYPPVDPWQNPDNPQRGTLYCVTYAGQIPVDCTPTVTRHEFYTWRLYDAPSVLVHMTEHPALTDTNRERLNLGVGEEVDLSGMPANTSWSVSAGGIVTNQYGFIVFTAPSNAVNQATVTAKVNVDYDAKWQTYFAVKQPTGVDPVHTYIIETNFPPISRLQDEQAGAGMHLHVCMKPTDVSFYRITMEEVGEDATSITGYFANAALFTTNPAVFLSHIGHGADAPFTLIWDNSWTNGDYCWSFYNDGFGFPLIPSGLYWLPGGSFTWNIPWNWWIAGNNATNHMTNGWQQVFEIEPYGTVKITKFGSKWVQRTTSGMITNSP
jgi:hypothetical protein